MLEGSTRFPWGGGVLLRRGRSRLFRFRRAAMSTPPAIVVRSLERIKSDIDSDLLWKFITQERTTDITPLKKLKDENKLDEKMTKMVKAYRDFK